jgi:hypothetical protein
MEGLLKGNGKQGKWRGKTLLIFTVCALQHTT